jgi:hypothetical protein
MDGHTHYISLFKNSFHHFGIYSLPIIGVNLILVCLNSLKNVPANLFSLKPKLRVLRLIFGMYKCLYHIFDQLAK